MPKHIDLLIQNDDLTLDAGGQPKLVADRASIAQDLCHMLRESGLLTALIGERDLRARRKIMVEITLAVDADSRIVPGSSAVKPGQNAQSGELWLFAKTREYGLIEFSLTAWVTAQKEGGAA